MSMLKEGGMEMPSKWQHAGDMERQYNSFLTEGQMSMLKEECMEMPSKRQQSQGQWRQ